ncbi:MAG: hypothetical protein QM727_13935 [Niabella sp.]
MYRPSLPGKYFLTWLFVFASLFASAQRMEADIFDNLQYESNDRRYEATLKRDIFDNLIFSDNQKNQVTFEKKYLDLKLPRVKDKESRMDFFRSLIKQYRREKNYTAKFSVDIFDKVIIQDNRNNRIEAGKDIFGNPSYEETSNGVKYSLKKDIFGNYQYTFNNTKATLEKNIFDEWTYSDTRDNKIVFGKKTWASLVARYRSEEKLFLFLINDLLR